MASDHHWEGETPDPSRYFGFVYLIENLDNGRKYIGKKQYFKSTGRSKSRAFDRRSPKWSENHWVENDWKTYKSSSKDLKKDVKTGSWRFEILSQWHTSRDLHYAEVEAQVERDVLLLVDDKGEYIYYNKAIAAVRFRPPTSHTEATREKLRGISTRPKDEKCRVCGSVEWAYIKTTGHRYCRPCAQKRNNAAYRGNKESRTEKARKYRGKNRERINELQKARRVAKKLTKQGIEWEPEMSPLDVFIVEREKK